SVVPEAGVVWVWTKGWGSWGASATLVLPFPARSRPHAGDSLRVSAAAQLQPTRAVATRLGIAARLDGGGERATDVRDPDSGGAAADPTPRVAVSPAPARG